jgi:hypothetical protein
LSFLDSTYASVGSGRCRFDLDRLRLRLLIGGFKIRSPVLYSVVDMFVGLNLLLPGTFSLRLFGSLDILGSPAFVGSLLANGLLFDIGSDAPWVPREALINLLGLLSQ